MCGRVVSVSSPDVLAAALRVEEMRIEEPLPERYNVAPSLPLYAVATRRARHGGAPTRQLGSLRWGLVPSWATDPKVGGRLTNARAETVSSKPAFRDAFARRRAIIPVDAFYEWRRHGGAEGGATKQPYAIRRRDVGFMAFAGLWEVWRDPAAPDSPLLRTCAIVTTRANDLMAPIHDRMPAILPADAWDTWLDLSTDEKVLASLLRPCPDDWLEAWPVSTLVNHAAVDNPGLLEPLAAPPGRSEPDRLPFGDSVAAG
jgi:putative SOS response-associated peptidase YedK